MCTLGPALVILVYLTEGLQAMSLSSRINKLSARRPLVAGSRPMPSDRLPVIDLQEQIDPNLDPKSDDLNLRKLYKILGTHFNPEFMSVEQPLETIPSPDGTIESQNVRDAPRDIKRLVKKILAKGDNSVLKVSKRIRNKIRRFLLSYTQCPVLHKWKDLGVRFWPRWIKTGSCDSRRSCSIPTGMKCKAKGSSLLTLLRFHCRTWNKERECAWIQIQYPVVSSCKCGC